MRQEGSEKDPKPSKPVVARAKTSSRNFGGSSTVNTIKGECFAEAYISTAETTSRQDTRISFAHEDRRGPQSACGAAQEGTPSPQSRIARIAPPGASGFRATRAWYAAEILTWFTAPGSACRVRTSPPLFARTNCLEAASVSASKRHWEARWCATACGEGCAKWCAAAGRRYPRDGTS